jgi:uncharacterized protein (TIGR02001 family)
MRAELGSAGEFLLSFVRNNHQRAGALVPDEWKRGIPMKKIVVASLAALAISAGSAFAASAPKWDVAVGAGVVSDYLFRGVTQSNHKPSFGAYLEPRYNITPTVQAYAGIAYNTIRFANDAKSEIDFYGGIRPTIGKLALDVGLWYYYYPGGTCYFGNAACPLTLANANVIKKDVSFWEVYFKPTYNFSDSFAVGGNLFYTPSFLNSGAPGTYLSATAKYTFPAMKSGVALYVSGEFGRQWLGTSDTFYSVPAFPAGIDYVDYNTWNLGLGWTWKMFTVDLRYTDTDLSKGDCNAFTSDHSASPIGTAFTPINPSGVSSNWCGARFTGKLSVDITTASFK